MTGQNAPIRAAFLCFVAAIGCKSPSAKGGPTSTASASAAAATVSAPASSAPAPPLRRYVPEGPVLGIFAGEGVGPIRFGANVGTIERLMEAPCEIKTADSCRYIERAVEFQLKDGVVDRIVISSHKRLATPFKDDHGQPRWNGFFNGVIPPDLYFGMVPKAIRDVLGAPKSTEQVSTPNEFNTVQRDTYPGLVAEYDKYENGNLILGAIILTKK